mgnify:CR=1 FL=1
MRDCPELAAEPDLGGKCGSSGDRAIPARRSERRGNGKIRRRIGETETSNDAEEDVAPPQVEACLLYTSDAADDRRGVLLWGGGGGV